MTRQDQQDAFDRQARVHYRHAASTLSPALQGRLRAARRTALAGDAGRHEAGRRPSWSVLPLAAVAAAVFALAIGLRWQRGADNGPMLPTGTSETPAVAVQTVVDPDNPQPDAGNPDVSTTDTPDTHVQETAVSDTDAPETVTPDPVAPDPAPSEHVAMQPQAPDESGSGLSSEVDPALLVLDEDPDFYLWLGGDDALPASPEPPHDAT